MNYDPLTLHEECTRMLRRKSRKSIWDYVQKKLSENGNSETTCDTTRTINTTPSTSQSKHRFDILDCLLCFFCLNGLPENITYDNHSHNDSYDDSHDHEI